jgi:hypothetical protein
MTTIPLSAPRQQRDPFLAQQPSSAAEGQDLVAKELLGRSLIHIRHRADKTALLLTPSGLPAMLHPLTLTLSLRWRINGPTRIVAVDDDPR